VRFVERSGGRRRVPAALHGLPVFTTSARAAERRRSGGANAESGGQCRRRSACLLALAVGIGISLPVVRIRHKANLVSRVALAPKLAVLDHVLECGSDADLNAPLLEKDEGQ
jgi:hypothetical protein